MQATPPYDDILEDETLAPLKRNHACLQCKKRKVKCDAVRPTCNPCMRSHAHALRSAQRNKSRPPPLVCTYAEDDGDVTPDPEPERKRVSSASGGIKKQVVGNGERTIHREKERRVEEERDTLKARISELEARIAALTTNESNAMPANPKAAYVNDLPNMDRPVNGLNGTWTMPMSAFPAQLASIDTSPSMVPPFVSVEAGAPGSFQSFDFSNLLLLPNHWPKNLPSPAILEHLIETFFQCEPQLPRMLHRATLLTRIRLPPNNPDFPLPALLHAICAAAAPHTAWINSLTPEEAQNSRRQHIDAGLDLEACPDFATAQNEAAERSIRHSTLTSSMGSGQDVFDLVRAHIILSMNYLNSGMGLRGWMTGGVPGRLIKLLEIANRNHTKRGEKPPLLTEPKDDREREERLATVWVAYLVESGFASNACWASSLSLDEILVPLPTSSEEFLQRYDQTGYMKPNPQTAHDPDVLTHHPLTDPFVLVVKSSLLLGRVARWIYNWRQRIVCPGDELEGMSQPSFAKLLDDIAAFEAHLPSSLKNIYRLVDSGSVNTITSELLSVHIFPKLSVMLLYEPFLDWDRPAANPTALYATQRAFEGIVSLIHLIPTQLDVTQLFTPLLAFSMFTVGRMVSRFAFQANRDEQYAIAMRWRADLISINSVLQRYAAKHVVGNYLQQYIANHVKMHEEGRKEIDCTHDCARPPNTSTMNSPSGTPDGEMGTRSSAASVSGVTSNSPMVSSSLGRTPESVEAVDAATQASSSSGSSHHHHHHHSHPHLTPDYMQQTLGQPSDQGFDPSLLEFLDPTAAAQVQAALAAANGKLPEGPQSPLSQLLAGLSSNNMSGLGSPGSTNGVVNLMGGDISGWSFSGQFNN